MDQQKSFQLKSPEMEFQDGGKAMAAILFFQMAATSKATYPRWCHTTLLSFKSIGRSVLELESGKGYFKMALTLFFQMAPILKTTQPSYNLGTKMLTDRRMDVGHINLIGGLVTCNMDNDGIVIIYLTL